MIFFCFPLSNQISHLIGLGGCLDVTCSFWKWNVLWGMEKSCYVLSHTRVVILERDFCNLLCHHFSLKSVGNRHQAGWNMKIAIILSPNVAFFEVTGFLALSYLLMLIISVEHRNFKSIPFSWYCILEMQCHILGSSL